MDRLRVDFSELILRVCEIMIDDAVVEVNVILLGMYATSLILENELVVQLLSFDGLLHQEDRT